MIEVELKPFLITEGPSLDSLKLSHSLLLTNFLEGDWRSNGYSVTFTLENPNVQSRLWTAISPEDRKRGTRQLSFEIFSLKPAYSDDQDVPTYKRNAVLGLEFSGATTYNSNRTNFKGFYYPKARDGYIFLPE